MKEKKKRARAMMMIIIIIIVIVIITIISIRSAQTMKSMNSVIRIAPPEVSSLIGSVLDLLGKNLRRHSTHTYRFRYKV